MDQYSFFGDESKIFFQITLISFTYTTIQAHGACNVVITRTSEH